MTAPVKPGSGPGDPLLIAALAEDMRQGRFTVAGALITPRTVATGGSARKS